MDALANLPIGPLSLSGLLLLVVLMIFRGDIVPRRTHEAVERDRDEWREIALRALDVNEKGIQTAAVATHALDQLPAAPAQEATS